MSSASLRTLVRGATRAAVRTPVTRTPIRALSSTPILRAADAPQPPAPRKGATPYTAKSREYEAAGEAATSSSIFARFITPAVAKRLAPVFGLQSKAQTHQRETLYMYERCSAAANAHLDWLIRDVGLPDTFQTWFGVTQVHVWMAMVRLRGEGPAGKDAIQGLVSHLFRDMEDRLWAMGIRKNAIVDRSLKEFLSIFYGGIMSYDEALVHSDALLASALWRNLFQSQADPQHLAEFVAVVRKELAHLETVDAETVLAGRFHFLNEATAAPASSSVASGTIDDSKPLSPDEMRALQQHLGGL
ncbi:Serine carboxypeptidase 3 [Blastocladiella emersonii ATCC 22665]|nr:Serine carboxypeptidase 3 [Blastocladiella emersonii ATCC 22665]